MESGQYYIRAKKLEGGEEVTQTLFGPDALERILEFEIVAFSTLATLAIANKNLKGARVYNELLNTIRIEKE